MIRSLNLDSMFQPTAFPEIEFELIKFSGGELHIKLNKRIVYSDVEKVVITHRVNNMDNLMAILITVDALRRVGIKHFDLVMPYIPYARQDRYDHAENYGESFTLDVFANLINSAGFEVIHTLDAHSDVSKALIKNVNNKNNFSFVINAISHTREVILKPSVAVTSYTTDKFPLWLISPDSGANKKCNPLHTQLSKCDHFKIEGLVKCDKHRDVATGKLSGFEVPLADLRGIDCVIVDDICDGGGTFLGLAEELINHNAGQLYLVVTFGIFSQGFLNLSKYFKRIYTTNGFREVKAHEYSEYTVPEDFVKQYKLYL